MKLDDMVTLAQAGFTKKEILAIAGDKQDPAGPEKKKQEQPPAENGNAQGDQMAQILKAMQDLTAAVQANGLKGAAHGDEDMSDDEILAQILMPGGNDNGSK